MSFQSRTFSAFEPLKRREPGKPMQIGDAI
jgi:hypothetical protein